MWFIMKSLESDEANRECSFKHHVGDIPLTVGWIYTVEHQINHLIKFSRFRKEEQICKNYM